MTSKRSMIWMGEATTTMLWLLMDVFWAHEFTTLAIVSGISCLGIHTRVMGLESLESRKRFENISVMLWIAFNLLWLIDDTYPTFVFSWFKTMLAVAASIFTLLALATSPKPFTRFRK